MDKKAKLPEPKEPDIIDEITNYDETLLTFDELADKIHNDNETAESDDSDVDSVEKVRQQVSARQKRKERRAERKKRFVHPILTILITLILLVGLAAGGFVFYLSRPIYIEAGDEPSLGIIETNSIISTLCRINSDVSNIDTSQLGDNKLSATLFGFLPFDLNVVVRDTTAPEFTVCQLFVSAGSNITADNFVIEYNDSTDVTFSLEGELMLDEVEIGRAHV